MNQVNQTQTIIYSIKMIDRMIEANSFTYPHIDQSINQSIKNQSIESINE